MPISVSVCVCVHFATFLCKYKKHGSHSLESVRLDVFLIRCRNVSSFWFFSFLWFSIGSGNFFFLLVFYGKSVEGISRKLRRITSNDCEWCGMETIESVIYIYVYNRIFFRFLNEKEKKSMNCF